MMIQRSREQTIRSGKRVVLGALVAGLVLGGLALHLSAETTRADCLSINGATISFGNGDGTCASSVGGSAVAQSSSSVSSSTNGGTTSSTTVVSQSSNGGDATAVVSSDTSSGGTVSIQNSDGASCGSPSMVLGPAGISMSSGSC